jgi:hypothetical protein
MRVVGNVHDVGAETSGTGEGGSHFGTPVDHASQAGKGIRVATLRLRTTSARDDKDPSRVVNMVIFESGEKARALEREQSRQESLAKVRELKAEIFEGPPQFTDLTVLEDTVY